MPFSPAIRRHLSHEAGGFCSNPDCRAPTGVVTSGEGRSVGDAAHIVAENPDGPRGQSPLTPEERAMASNGVWLCPNCHRTVDKVRPQDFSVGQLREWKANAPIWWAQNQGKALQRVASPGTRPRIARPSTASLQGAKNFHEAHEPLFRLLWNFRHQMPGLSERGALIPDEIELKIRHMSSSPSMGRSWQDEWSTTFHCEDQELVDHMRGLVYCVDEFCRPLSAFIKDGPRRVVFNPPDELGQAILNYLHAWKAFGSCLETNNRF